MMIQLNYISDQKASLSIESNTTDHTAKLVEINLLVTAVPLKTHSTMQVLESLVSHFSA